MAAETDAEHAAHGSPASALEAHIGPNHQVVQGQVEPAESSDGQEIRFKELGDWEKEAPKREPGYIEGVGYDDILSDDYFVRQILTADPVISYEVYPIPQAI